MSALPLLLHVWPGRWDLPSIDASCIEAILYLQLTFPKCYSIVETADPDLSPNGQLPFLIHGQLTVSSLPSIVSYLSGLDKSILLPADSDDAYDDETEPSRVDLDTSLSGLQGSQATAWRAYVEAQLSDLVTHSFFVLHPNYRTFTHGLLASILPVPQRYYVPGRIREGHRPRLEAVGLWQIANEPEDFEETKGIKRPTEENKEQKIRRAFGQVKVVERARLVFDILSRLLDQKSFIFNDRPSIIDLALASRILLFMKAPMPNAALKEVLESSYPTLVAHASRTYDLAFPSSPSASRPPILPSPRANPLSVLRSSLVHFSRDVTIKQGESEEAKRFRRYRWGWFGLAMVGIVSFVVTTGIRVVRVVNHEGEEEEPETVIEDDDDDESADI